ncbi:MAG: PAS domain-containing protein [Gammaproteobacteria bacterium]|nr:PAS domain-containing protein [Gammaproteobacteria bacterium]
MGSKLKYFYYLIAFAVIGLSSSSVYASLVSYFEEEDGSTNWQYVANWSSGILIILLSIAAIVLYFSRREVSRSNMALQDINDELEERVKERTATLDESNHKLIQANELLEGEISEHKQTSKQLLASETYIKSILESMPVMLVGLNKDLEVTQWNQTAELITRIKAKDALGKNLWQAHPTIPLPQERVQEAVESGEVVQIRSSQRGQIHFEITIYPLANYNETGLVIMLDDVTQQVKSENKLIEEDKISAMGELSLAMAFDINAPVTHIKRELEKMQRLSENDFETIKAADFDQVKNFITNLSEQSQRASAIVQNLLEFSTGSKDSLQKVDIIRVIDHSLELSREIFNFNEGVAFAEVEIERLYEDSLPEIPCYSSELQQVFVSLFRYCLYALRIVDRENHQPKITVQVLTSYDSLWVKIQHNGAGIDLDEQQVIFEPFFSDEALNEEEQYEASKRLSFPYYIVTQHHKGQMAVTSNVDIGTTFHIELNLR